MNDIQCDIQMVDLNANWRLRGFAIGEETVLRQWRVARKDVGENRGEDEANGKAKIEVVKNRPAPRNQACETFVEKHNGDLDEAHGDEKGHLGDGGKLVHRCWLAFEASLDQASHTRNNELISE